MVFDLVLVDLNYVNSSHFVNPKEVKNPIAKSEIDQRILLDKGHYRVANFAVNPMNDGTTSYYHLSIGGYHAAKPGRYQELFDYQIAKNNMAVLNMLNTKYIIYPKDGKEAVQLNPNALSPAWFVNKVKYLNSANLEMLSLNEFKAKDLAIINNSDFPNAKNDLSDIAADSTAQIKLVKYLPNKLNYVSQSTKPQLAVFSEMYYKEGWQATIDDNPALIYRVNYVLRALKIPAGKHTILFQFKPQVIQRGNIVTGISFGLLLIILIGWVVYDKKKLN